jgi:hypothetical protein
MLLNDLFTDQVCRTAQREKSAAAAPTSLRQPLPSSVDRSRLVPGRNLRWRCISPTSKPDVAASHTAFQNAVKRRIGVGHGANTVLRGPNWLAASALAQVQHVCHGSAAVYYLASHDPRSRVTPDPQSTNQCCISNIRGSSRKDEFVRRVAVHSACGVYGMDGHAAVDQFQYLTGSATKRSQALDRVRCLSTCTMQAKPLLDTLDTESACRVPYRQFRSTQADNAILPCKCAVEFLPMSALLPEYS